MQGRLVSLVIALWVVIALPAAAIAAPSADDGDAVMALSSWSPTFAERVVVGGTMTVTVTNVGDVATATSHSLATAPCTCSILSVEASSGSVGEEWDIDSLAPGETATLTVEYGSDLARLGFGRGLRIA